MSTPKNRLHIHRRAGVGLGRPSSPCNTADSAVEMMAAAFDGGINFFDNAEGYAGGRSEEIMGQALKRRQAAQKPSTLNSRG